MTRTWFITGTSRGLGRAFAEAALGRGDRVVATARSTAALSDLRDDSGRLLRLALDVTDEQQVTDAVRTGTEHFGGLDVVVNNAAGGEQGPAVEELDPESLRRTMEVNFFGAVAVTRAVLPVLREQRRGHLVQMSSMGGLVGLPFAGGYIASKWALEGITESLAQEVAGFGVHVTLVEPTAFATGADHAPSGPVRTIADYDGVRAGGDHHGGPAPGDPAAAAQALLRLVDAEHPPLRAILGVGGTQFIGQVYAERLAAWQAAAGITE